MTDRLLKGTLWLWLAGPLVQLGLLVVSDGLGANPQETLLRALGQQILGLLLFILMMPMLGRLLTPGLLACRRMVGLWTFFYACLHMLAYAQFEHDLDWVALAHDGIQRPFVTVGLLTLALMAPLAATSNRLSMRRLGRRWKQLHQLVWPIVVLGLVHYFLHKAGKQDFQDPIFASLLLLTIWALRRWAGAVVRRQPGRGRSAATE